jgi:hypothetical protein
VARRLVIRIVAGVVAAIVVAIIAIVVSQGGSGNSNANANPAPLAPIDTATGLATPQGDASPQASPSGGQSRNTDEEGLATGDCFDLPSSSQIGSVSSIPCTQAHDSQVFAEFNLSGSAYPGTSTVEKEADSGCQSRQSALDQAEMTSSIQQSYLYPQEDGWYQGDDTVTCVVTDSSPTLTTSLLNG